MAESTTRPLVIGVGNRDRGDDGVGPLAALAFAERWPDCAEIYLAEGDLSDLLLRWRSDQSVVIIDAVVSDRTPGTISTIDGLDAQLPLDEQLVSSHGVGVAEAIALAKLLDRRPATITIIGVEAAQCGHFMDLSGPVASALPEVVDRISQVLDATRQPAPRQPRPVDMDLDTLQRSPGSPTSPTSPETSATPRDDEFNAYMVQQLELGADLLETQRANQHRILAYRRAATALHRLDEPASVIYRREGLPGLIALPAIGRSFALAIADVVETGRWRWIDRLRGHIEPEQLLGTVAGIGPVLAHRLHLELDIETLEELEAAAHSGQLAALPGFGAKRVQSIRDSLAGRLIHRRSAQRDELAGQQSATPQALLDIDREYRAKAIAGQLPTIVPRRFNPDHQRSIPMLHTTRHGQHFTALYSNTAQAHRLGRIDDWVVIYADAPDQGHWTVVTETRGPRAGDRAVRGARQ